MNIFNDTDLLNEALTFNSRNELINFFSYPNSVSEYLQTAKNKPELYWKNLRADSVPGLILFRSDKDPVYPLHTNEDLVLITLISYEGSKDYTGKGYAFAINQVMNGRVVKTSYRTVFDVALDVYDTYATEITKPLKLCAWLNTLTPHELDVDDGAVVISLFNNECADEAKCGEIWEYLFMFFRKEMKKYFKTVHNANHIVLFEAKKYPSPCIDASFDDEHEEYYLWFGFEDGCASHVVKNPLIKETMETLYKNRRRLMHPVNPPGKTVKLENKVIISIEDIEGEALAELKENAEVLAYEEELMEHIKETAPENYADEKLFWFTLLTFYARHRMNGEFIEEAIKNGFREAMEYWSKDFPKQDEKWIPVYNPYKEDEVRLTLHDDWNGSYTGITKQDIVNIINALKE